MIRPAPGFYEGPVFHSAKASPLTLLGAGPGEVTFTARIDAQMPGRKYEERPAARFASSVPEIRAGFARVAERERISVAL